MKVLGLDTATLTSGIALVDDGVVLAEARHDASGRTADLLVAIDTACKRAGLGPRDLDAIAIGAGPGSFTGLRIGMATAKGIAFATGKPLWAVSSLAALAHDAERAAPGHGQLTVAILDARRGEVFAGCYLGARLVGDERVLAPEAVAAWVGELAAGEDRGAGPVELRYVGDAITTFPAVFATLADRWLVTTPSGHAVAQLALAGARVDVVTGGVPTYIRPSEAEVMYPDGVPGALPRNPA